MKVDLHLEFRIMAQKVMKFELNPTFFSDSLYIANAQTIKIQQLNGKTYSHFILHITLSQVQNLSKNILFVENVILTKLHNC